MRVNNTHTNRKSARRRLGFTLVEMLLVLVILGVLAAIVYPKGISGLLDLVQKPRDAVNWRGPYLDNIPKDPWGNDYVYECPGKHNTSSYDVMSVGPDTRSGTDDDIGNWQTAK
jgi:prepilin-type N-terminal cleavage/methylation domain-containing protein